MLQEAGARREVTGLPSSGLIDLDYEQNIRLRKWYAISVLIALGAQIIAANTIFVLYAAWGAHWKVEVTLMQAWLAATVVQVVGIVLVVTRSLFPPAPTR